MGGGPTAPLHPNRDYPPIQNHEIIPPWIASNPRSIKSSPASPTPEAAGVEATKQSLVLPLLDALGYDIWNPAEVCPEYEADFAIRKYGQKEKVDLALFLQDVPRIYVEVKSADEPLDGHEGQLSRYFNATPTGSLAVLTNGIEYRFHTDTAEANVMDPRPFHTARFDALDQGLEVLARFQKSVFSPEAIREYARERNDTARIVDFLRDKLDLRDRNPSEDLVRWILASASIYDRRVTVGVVSPPPASPPARAASLKWGPVGAYPLAWR